MKGFLARKNRGFTLIELMVVIAIIGILASVVMMSLSGARSKGTDASITEDLGGLRTLAEYVYDLDVVMFQDMPAQNCLNAKTYATTLAAGNPAKIALINQAVTAIGAAGNASNGGGVGRATCAALVGNTWAVSVPLKSDPTKSWCVDSTGVSKEITGAITTSACS